jgi:hypothetical protein
MNKRRCYPEIRRQNPNKRFVDDYPGPVAIRNLTDGLSELREAMNELLYAGVIDHSIAVIRQEGQWINEHIRSFAALKGS